MAIIPTTTDLIEHGVYDVSRLRGDYLRRVPRYPGGEYEGDADGTEGMHLVANPCAYGFGPDDTAERWVLLGFNAVVSDIATANFNAIRFGQGWWLTNGVSFQVVRGGVTQTFARIQTNGDWVTLCGKHVRYVGFAPHPDFLFAKCRFKAPHRFILDGARGDIFQVLIDDDIQQLEHFSVYAWAYKL